MSKLVRKRRFLNVWCIGETESWFTDMAEQGLHLKSLGATFARFERGEPKKMRYRIDYTYRIPRTPESESEQRELYAESGWEFVCEQNDMYVFRSPEESDAPELHTDPTEQAYTLLKLKKRFTNVGIFCLIAYAVIIAIFCFSLFYGGTPTLVLVEGSTNMPILVPVYLYLAGSSAGIVISIRKLVRSLSEGREINHRADWMRLRRSNIIALILLTVMIPCLLAPPVAALAMQRSGTLPIVNTDQMFIRLADIENDPALERRDGFLIRDVDYRNYFRSEWSLFAPVIHTIYEQGAVPGRRWVDNSGEYSPSIDCTIYKLRFAGMAEGLMRDLLHKYERYDAAPIVEETGHPGFDSLYTRETQFRCEVFACRGDTVVRLLYYGERDMQTIIDAVAAYFSGG